ncbi:PAS/PAC sensor signal transduction histidine kinase [Scytonema sp. HK-05]|uniref:PAS domain-containing protein n=1 Tax=Scytonema sp. HK-05 TaxID=1137095 RepID=UPI00093637BC|nr:PAS domain-containing protein [Scytonema sp. HK-05]OKH47052.1 hypothetical protein NIES2130_36200 [Scytonema sp. HK-05]BAY43770.1 PAS/PAC sensor signal transduction histidine kinase [Scytonema sp. HK-05]
MYIEGPATNEWELQLSSQSTQNIPKQEQLQTDQVLLEKCQCLQADWQEALATSRLGLWNWNLVSDKIYYTPHWKHILGYEAEEIENNHTSFKRLVHPQDLSKLCEVVNDYLQGRTPVYEVEFRMLSKSGEWKWILDRGKVLQWDESGKPVQMVGTHQDITKEKRLEEALQQQQKREQLLNAVRKRIHSSSGVELILQTAVEEVQRFLQTEQTVIYRFGPDGSGMVVFESVKEPYPVDSFIESQNKASLVVPILLKVQEDENKPSVSIQNPQLALLNSCLGESQNDLWGLLIAYDCCGLRQWQEWEIETVKQLSVEIAIALKQCQLFEQIQTEIASRLFIEAQEKKKSEQLENTQQELKNTRKQLLQNNKMANLGQVVAQVTNEIYHPTHFIHATLYSASDYAEELIRLLELYQHYYPNPVPVITSQLQRLDLDFIKTDFLKLLWSMRAGSERMKEIVFALQSFSNCGDGQMRKANLHEGLGHVLRILQHRLKELPDRPRIEVIKEFGDLPLVESYPDELNQVFINILTNAIDAIEERLKYDDSFTPKIWVYTEVIQSHLSLVRSYEQQPLKQHKVVIRISDNGKGILPHIQRHIFEPLFTTKPKSKGKGLGLSISQQIIVERHQGKLQCYSQLGKGTEFVIEMNIKALHRYHQTR